MIMNVNIKQMIMMIIIMMNNNDDLKNYDNFNDVYSDKNDTVVIKKKQ